MSKLYIKKGTVVYDVMKYDLYKKHGVSASLFREGDLVKKGVIVYPILRETKLSLGGKVIGTNMKFNYSYNDTLLNNPKIAIMGSSSAVSQGLPFSQSIEKKLQDYFIANHGGCTTQNFGLSGADSSIFLPISMGGTPANSIDTALASDPTFIVMYAPSNDITAGNTNQQWLDNVKLIRTYAMERGVRLFLQSPGPRTAFNLTQQTQLRNAALLQLADPDLQYDMYDVYNSSLWDKSDLVNFPARGTALYYQGDNIHLNDAGTTYMVSNLTVPLLERELRANTAYLEFKIEVSSDGLTGWTTFDTITDQQIVNKTYTLSAGYYRVTAKLKDNTYLPYSNIVQIIDPGPPSKTLQVSFSKTAGTPEIGWYNLFGDPATSSPSYTDPSTGWTVKALPSVNWTPLGGSNANNALGATVDDGGGWVFPQNVMYNFWFNYSTNFTTGVYHVEVSGLDPAKTYDVTLSGSRAGTGGTPNIGAAFNFKGLGANQQQLLTTWNNSSKFVKFTDQPDASGIILVAVNKQTGTTMGNNGHMAGIKIDEL